MTSSVRLNSSSDIETFLTKSFEQRESIINNLRELGFSDDDIERLYKLNLGGNDYNQFAEFRLHKLLLLYVPPFLLVLGTLGNLFSFLILRHKSMNQQSIYIYLSTLAVFDSLVLYFGLIRLWVNEISGSDIRNESAWLCKGLPTLGYTFSDVSVWLIVAVTVERYFVVSHPFKASYFCQDIRAKKIIAGLVVVFFSINAHLLFSTDIVVDRTNKVAVAYVCGPVPGFETLIEVVWPWVDALLYGFGPFVLISVLNSIIVIKICKANNSRAKLVQGRSHRSNTSTIESGNIRITIMLLTISFTFLLTTLPTNLAKIVSIWGNQEVGNRHSISKGFLFDTLASLLMYLNHSVNFLLYCATGRKFRAVVARCFFSKIRPRTVPTLDHSQHLFCSRKRSGLDCPRSSKESQESQV